MIIYLYTIFISLLFFGFTKPAEAVPPPDFIFNIGSQIVQIFTFLILGFSVVLGSLRRFFQSHILFTKYGKAMWFLLAIFVIFLSLVGAYYYEQYRQSGAYKTWVTESKNQTVPELQSPSNLDLLQVGQLNAPISARGEMPEDKGTAFIKSYYSNLAKGNFEEAYAVSSQTVPIETYKSWYKDTKEISVDSIQKISGNTYSLGLSLKETTGTTRYAVLMKLAGNNDKLKIESSDVRVLATDTLTATDVESSAKINNNFFEENKNLNLSISNEEFKQITSQPGAYILDAREDEEYEIGRFPQSTHIRFADLKAGQWISLPEDKVIYVICWSGIRGKEVSEFLRTKNIVARFLEKGAQAWVTFGGEWIGGIKFLSKYTADQYQIVYSSEDVKKFVGSGVVLVDSRQPDKYLKHHILGSISIPIIYTPTSQMETALSQVPQNSKIITICDDFVSCFDAKVTGVKLEKRGNIFLGRYNKPWEY